MRKLGLIAACLLICGVLAQVRAQRSFLLRDDSLPVASSFTPSCTASSNWLARATNVTLTADKTNYDNLLCGLNTDGVLSKLDALYIYAAPDSTTAKLNTVQNAFNSTQTGSLTFTAYTGFTGDATTGFLDTGFNPNTAAGNYVQNAASLSACVLSSRTTNQGWMAIGTSQVNFSLIEPLGQFSAIVQFAVNSVGVPNAVNANAQGLWTASRTTSSLTTLYHNGTSFASAGTDTSGAVDNQNIFVFARNVPPAGGFTGDQQAAAAIGGGLTASDASNLRTRINTYLTAYGVSGC